MDYLLQYKQYLQIRNYSEHTVIHYLSDLNLFQKHVEKPWSQVNKADIAKYVNEMVHNEFSPRTINRRLWVIKGFYDYLHEELDCHVKNPVRSSHILRTSRRLPQTLEEDDIRRFLEVITDTRDSLIFSLMLRCGLRVSEIANLEIQNINLFRRDMRILGKGKKERVIPIPQELHALFLECLHIRPKNNPKFFWNKKHPERSLKINSIQYLLKRYAKKAGVTFHCHLARHTFARQMTENGVERTVLRDLMGHASIASTDVYGKLSDPFIKDSYFKAMEKILSED